MIYSYIILQFIMVLLNTFKSIVIVKSTPTAASLVTTISYTLNAVIIKFVTKQEFIIVIIVTIFTNLIGVALARYILDIISKDKLWVYDVTIKDNLVEILNIKHQLKDIKINCMYNEIVQNELYEIKIFSTSKENSRDIKSILSNYSCKYHIIETI